MKLTIAALLAAQAAKSMTKPQVQAVVNGAKGTVNRVAGAMTSYLDTLTDEHDVEINDMLKSGDIYFKGGKLYYTESDEPYKK